MKKFLFKIFVLLSIFLISDHIIGKVGVYMSERAKGGYGRTAYPIYHSNEDVMIFGSSRAVHHYVPEVVSDSLNLSCYNCGLDGNGVLFYYPSICEMLKRHTPKCIIIDVEPCFDLVKYKDNERYIEAMKPFLNENMQFDYIATQIDPTINIKKHFGTFRFNSAALSLLSSYKSSKYFGQNGYIPLNGKFVETETLTDLNYEYDSLKLNALESAIALASSKTNVVVCVSPKYGDGLPSDVFNPLENICNRYNVPFVFYWKDTVFNERKYFKDSGHLNDFGAKLYTTYILEYIKSNIKDMNC